jgi:type I restriction enzyme, S subunit
MNKENKIVPELRFPEFKNKGEWAEKKLRLLAQKIVDKNKDGLINDVFTNSAIDGIVNQRDFFDKDIADKNNLENYYIVEDGDYVYNPRISNVAPVGPISKNKTNKAGAMSPLYTVFRFYDRNNAFYEYYFKSNHWYTAIRKAANTGARFDRMSITDSLFMDIRVLYPRPIEQQKIASCLSSLDELINAHSQKLNALKEHKKGLMQQLFPAEGETVPKLRFKEFEKDGEWVETTLGEVCKFVRGPFGGALKKEIFVSNGYAVYEQSHAIYNIFDAFRYFINDDKYKELKRFAVKAGDIIMSCSGTMGKFAIIPENCKLGVINQALLKLTVKKGYSIHFIKSILELPVNQEQILSQAGGGAIKNVASVSILQEIKIKIPLINEQVKITSCITSLDKQITAQAQKIEDLKAHKKGLMQGLFPVLNE